MSEPAAARRRDSGGGAAPPVSGQPLTAEQYKYELALVNASFWSEAALTVLGTACTFGLLYSASRFASALLPDLLGQDESSSPANERLAERLRECGRDPNVAHSLNKYEARVLEDLIVPSDVEVDFEQIGGLAQQKQGVFNSVILPLQEPDLFLDSGDLMSPPKGSAAWPTRLRENHDGEGDRVDE